jgi:flagellar biosynthesis protein FlhF
MPITAKPSTYVKSFFAESLQSAMEHAQVELGPDALLLDSHEAPPEARHLGDYEVVFAANSETPASAAAPAGAGAEALRRQMEEISELLGRIAPSSAVQRGDSDVVSRTLIAAGMDPVVARDIEEAARLRTARRSVRRIGAPRLEGGLDVQNLLNEAAEEISASFAVAPEAGHAVALVGPPGSGKTTTLVKLAITQGLSQGRAIRLISADTYRIGGAEQLRTYAAIIGAPFQAVESVAALAHAVDTAPESTLVLIDSPGYSATIMKDLGGDLATFLSRRQDIDTHLVLTASMRIEDLYRAAGLYDVFRPSKLLFTKVDEASSLAGVFCLAARRNLPVSYFSTGQSVPEDLEPATKERVVGSLVRQLPCGVEAVA